MLGRNSDSILIAMVPAMAPAVVIAMVQTFFVGSKVQGGQGAELDA